MGLSVPEVVSGLKTALSYAQEQLESLISHSGKIFNKNNQILDKCHELWPIIMASRDLRTARIGPIFSKFCLSWFMENSSYRRFQNRVALERPISGKLIQNNLVDKKYLTNFGSWHNHIWMNFPEISLAHDRILLVDSRGLAWSIFGKLIQPKFMSTYSVF